MALEKIGIAVVGKLTEFGIDPSFQERASQVISGNGDGVGDWWQNLSPDTRSNIIRGIGTFIIGGGGAWLITKGPGRRPGDPIE